VAFTQLPVTAGHLRDAVGDRGSPMLGRGAEFETVLGLLDDTRQGQGRVLLVEGEPGMRESLLLARAVRKRPLAVSRGGRIAPEHAWSEAAQTPRLGDVRGPAWRRG
jgi:hypothetical protein